VAGGGRVVKFGKTDRGVADKIGGKKRRRIELYTRRGGGPGGGGGTKGHAAKEFVGDGKMGGAGLVGVCRTLEGNLEFFSSSRDLTSEVVAIWPDQRKCLVAGGNLSLSREGDVRATARENR